MSVFNCDERTSAQYTATLEGVTGIALPLASIVTAKLTLTDVETGTVINARNDQNVLNANNVTIHANTGLLTWSIQPDDNVIVTSGTEFELHRAVFEVVYAADQEVTHQMYLLVRNLYGVP